MEKIRITGVQKIYKKVANLYDEGQIGRRKIADAIESCIHRVVDLHICDCNDNPERVKKWNEEMHAYYDHSQDWRTLEALSSSNSNQIDSIVRAWDSIYSKRYAEKYEEILKYILITLNHEHINGFAKDPTGDYWPFNTERNPNDKLHHPYVYNFGPGRIFLEKRDGARGDRSAY